MKNTMITAFLTLNVVWLSLLSFATYAQTEENPELRRSSIVVVSQPGFKLQAQQVFFWTENYADVSGELKKSTFSVQQLIDTAIKGAIKAKGFAFKDKVKIARDLVTSIKALRDEKEDEKKIPDLAMLINNLEENDKKTGVKRITRGRAIEQIEIEVD